MAMVFVEPLQATVNVLEILKAVRVNRLVWLDFQGHDVGSDASENRHDSRERKASYIL